MGHSTRKRVYLHIGLPKTGTTTIQRALKLNEAWLNSQGYVIPQAGMPTEVLNFTQPDIAAEMAVHHNLAWQHFAPDLFRSDAGTSEDLAEEIGNHHAERFIVSSEQIVEIDPEYIATALQKVADVIAIVYLRRQDFFLQSMYTQRIKYGDTTETFQEAYSRLIHHYAYLRYQQFLDHLTGMFGADNLRVRNFDDVVQHGDLISDFFTQCDVMPSVDVQAPPPDNETPSIKTLELVRAVQCQLNERGNVYSWQDMPHYKVMRLILVHAQAAGWDTNKAKFLTPELSQAILAHYDEDNRSVAQTYFGRDNLFDSSPVVATPPFDVQDISVDELLGVVAHICEAYVRDVDLLQKQISATTQVERDRQVLADRLNAIESTRAWRWINWYWRVRDRLRAIIGEG